MNLIETAKSVGAVEHEFSDRITLDPEQLQAFADAIKKEKDSEIEQLNAKVAMMRDALTQIEAMGIGNSHGSAVKNLIAKQALSSTEKDVAKWVNKVKADALEEASDINGFDSSSAAALIDSAKQLRGEKV